jgi:hypothetical protein
MIVNAPTIETIIKALDLPPGSRVDQRVPKKLLLESGSPTTADKRRINEGIESLQGLAALKPTTVGVPVYRDVSREYVEIAVLRLSLRAAAKLERLVELLHRAVPYPVLLLTEQESTLDLSAAQKRWAQNEAGKTVLDGEVVRAGLTDQFGLPYMAEFQFALALGHQPRSSLYALYQGWIDVVLAFQTAKFTSKFSLPTGPEHAATRKASLREYVRIESEIARLRAAAAKEKQMARKVDLNLALKRAEAELTVVRTRLGKRTT